MLRLIARAKINWTLDIVGRRADGYHLMDMLMSSVELADMLDIEPAEDISLQIATPSGAKNCANPGHSMAVRGDETNLVIKAARALQRVTGCAKGAAMRLEKHIPVGAGMGGGSADAAAALVGLHQLWELSLTDEQLAEIALSLGADIPFMLTGGLARVQGIGENIAPLAFPGADWLVLVQPCEGLSTKEIFTAFDALPESEIIRPRTADAQKALLTRNLTGLGMAMDNVMEPVSLERRPEMREALHALAAAGAVRAMMTGSGSVVYGVFANEQKARSAYEGLRARWEKCDVTKTCREGILCERG